nr:MAG TPA: hypothetical protein [Caudoviricetes sp.]
MRAVLRRGWYKLHGRHKTRCKRLCVAVLQQGKIKALHPQQMQGKRKARPFLTGWNAFYFDALNSAEKNQKKNRMQENITCRTSSYHAKTLVCGALAALRINIRVCCLQKLAIKSDALHILINGLCSALYHFRRAVHHVNYFSLYSVVHRFKLFN